MSKTKLNPLEKFYEDNQDKIVEFGDYFLSKLADKQLVDNLAEKDLEKLARVFKILFEKFNSDSPSDSDSPLLDKIVDFMNGKSDVKPERKEILKPKKKKAKPSANLNGEVLPFETDEKRNKER